MSRKNDPLMTNILAIHSEWLVANGYTLHMKKKKKTPQFKKQATHQNQQKK